MSNGVRQGGILSPLLFTIYIDNIFKKLKTTGMGCYIDDVFAGSFGYADDLVLIAPSLAGLKCMIKICEDYAEQYNILYNPKKSKLLHYNVAHDKEISIELCGTKVQIVDSEVYLGNFIASDLSDRNITSNMGDFYRRSNQLRADFYMLPSHIQYKLFTCYFINLCGCNLWNYNKMYVQKIYTAWRIVIRKLYKLPYTAHNYIVNGLN